MFYWLASNFWTMGQQFIVIRNMPTPGSQAHHAREARLAKKGKLPKKADEAQAEIVEETPRQRTQPTGKARAKKGKK
jgi:YidC/Oxa1 family membrane protein insertase